MQLSISRAVSTESKVALEDVLESSSLKSRWGRSTGLCMGMDSRGWEMEANHRCGVDGRRHPQVKLGVIIRRFGSLHVSLFHSLHLIAFAFLP